MLAKKIQEIYKEYKRLQGLSDIAEEAMMNAPEDEELDRLADEAYQEYWSAREQLIEVIMKVTKCNRMVANQMLYSDKLEELMSKKIV